MAIRAPREVRGAKAGRVDEIDLTDDALVDDATVDAPVDDRPVDMEELWQHRAELHKLCAKIVGDPITADDMVQETYLRALRNLDKLERRPSLMPWLATVARRRSLDELRSRRKVTPFEDTPETEARREDDPETQAAIGESMGEVADAMKLLNARERKLLRLQIEEGLSLAELAESEASTIDSVRSVLVRARTKLRQAISENVTYPAAAPLLGLGAWLRRRAGELNLRLQRAFSTTPLERVGEVLAASVVLVAVGAGGGAVPLDRSASSSLPSDAAANAEVAATTSAADAGTEDAQGAAGTASPSNPGSHPLAEPLPGHAALDQVIPGDDVKTTGDARFESFAVAASGSDTPLLLAGGTRREGCVAGCTVLFRSADLGQTWTRLAATGITGPTIALSPDFPSDPRIFAVGDEGLSVSRDGGATFEVVLAAAASTLAISPGFADGDERVFVGTGPAIVWNESNRSATPLLGLPTSPSTSFAFSPGYPGSGALYVGSMAPGATEFEAAVYRCTRALDEDSCVEPAPIPGLRTVPRVAVARDSGTVLAWASGALYRSTDDGVSFSTASVPGDAYVNAVADDGAGTLWAAVHSPSGAPLGGVLRSVDDGATWQRLGAGSPLAHGASAVVALPGGRVLAAPLAHSGGDIVCSDDGGSTWRAPCA